MLSDPDDMQSPWSLRNLCGAQMLLGGVCITLQIILMGTNVPMSHIGHGIWGGIVFMIAGLLGIVFTLKKTKTTRYVAMASLLIAKLIAIAVIVICIVQWARYARKEGSRKGFGFYPVPMIAILLAVTIAELVLAAVSNRMAKRTSLDKAIGLENERQRKPDPRTLEFVRTVEVEEVPSKKGVPRTYLEVTEANVDDIQVVTTSPADPPHPQPKDRTTHA